MARSPLPNTSDRIEESEIVEILGDGPVSRVYQVWNPTLGVHRTIKMLKRTASHAAQVRFFTEMQILAQLDHPGIPAVHRVGSWNGCHFFESDYFEGDSLAQLIQEYGSFHPELVCAIMVELSELLQCIHTEPIAIDGIRYFGILHRDIKPSNILLSPIKGSRLIDFGIASVSTNNSFPTKERNKIVGSIPYIAPEMLDAPRATSKADIFSLGAVLYEMSCGERLFPETDFGQLVRDRMNLASFDLSGVFPGFRGILASMLSRNPSDRPFSSKEIAETFRKLLRKWSSDTPRMVIVRRISGRMIRPEK